MRVFSSTDLYLQSEQINMHCVVNSFKKCVKQTYYFEQCYHTIPFQ
jgi:hypothetical protein